MPEVAREHSSPQRGGLIPESGCGVGATSIFLTGQNGNGLLSCPGIAWGLGWGFARASGWGFARALGWGFARALGWGLPGHLDGVLPRHLDGVLPGHLDKVLPGHFASASKFLMEFWHSS